MWPAVMFAANRNDSVIGRTSALRVSIRTKGGFSQAGAPPGSKAAAKVRGSCWSLEMIRAAHSGSPNVSVKIKWLVSLNTYGTNPERFIIIMNENSGTRMEWSPGRFFLEVRLACCAIISTVINSLSVNRVGASQKEERNMKHLVSEKAQNMGLRSEKIKFVLGSNAEKMSISIRD